MSALFAGMLLMIAAAPASPAARPTECGLTVRFGSYAMGVDRGAAVAVERLLRRDKAVRAVDRRPWGREGEFDLCVRTARQSDAKRLFGRIRPLLPAKPRGPITVSLAGGRSYSAPETAGR